VTLTARKSVIAALAAFAPVVIAVARLGIGDTPDPLPTHWNLGGSADGVTGANAFFAWCLAISAVAAVAGVILLASASYLTARWASLGALWVCWLACSLYVVTLLVAHGASVASEVELNPGWIVAIVVVPAAVVAVARKLLPWRSEHATRPPSRPDALQLEESERITWIGRTVSRPICAVGVLAGVVGLGLLVVSWSLGVAGLVLSAICLALGVVVVRADASGVHVSFGPLHWPTLTIKIEEIVSARAEFIEPTKWGGWGYRFSPRGRAVVLRRGEGLLLERADAPDFVVTIDGAHEAADVVNAVVSRRLSAH
jgi:hypothetical protein